MRLHLACCGGNSGLGGVARIFIHRPLHVVRRGTEANLLANILLRRSGRRWLVRVRQLHGVDPVEHADHRLLHGIEHRSGVLLAAATLSDEGFN